MSVNSSADYGKLENNENVPVNVKWHIKDQKNYSGSQEIFSDDDHAVDISYSSPHRVSAKNHTFNSSVTSLKTPILCSKAHEETPGRAAVPRTPADLIPHIKKTSILWTSDMETPQSIINERSKICDRTFNSIDNINKTPTRPKTPAQENMEIDPKDITSPVLGGSKRSKRKVKRRILNNLNLDSDNNNERQSNNSIDKVPSETASSPSSEVAFDIHKEVKKSEVRESNNLDDVGHKEIKLFEEAVNTDKNSNTSTQDFFSNASFTTIDKLCSAAIQEVVKPESNLNKIKDETIQVNLGGKEKDPSKNVSNDILERVAAIRKKQKPFRRSIDINQPAIPKEAFSKVVMELELADATFSREKKGASKIVKPMPLMSFSELSALDKDVKNGSIGKNVISGTVNNIPVKDVHDKLMNKSDQTSKNQCTLSSNYASTNNKIIANSIKAGPSKTTVEKEYLESTCSGTKSKESNKISNNGDTKSCNDQLDNKSYQNTDGFLTARGGNVPINQDQLLRYEKVYQEIENEVNDENDIVKSKQMKEQPKKLQPNLEKQASKGFKRTEKLKLQEDLKSKELLKPKCLQEDMETKSDDFSTARGGQIPISNEKENLYMQIYNELSDDPDLNSAKKPSTFKSNTNPGLKLNVSHRKAPTTSTVTSCNDVLTAQREKISTNKEKPNAFTSASNQFMKPSTSKNIENTISRRSNNGFETARGGDVAISNEIEKKFLDIYNEFNDIDEDSLLSAKTNKPSKDLRKGKPTDRVVLVFNEKTTAKTNVKALKTPSTKPSNDGFSTAKGIDIAISGEKESYYSRVYNELSDDVNIESSKNKSKDKPFIPPNQIKKDTKPVIKEEKDIDADDEIGDLAELFFSPPHHSNYPDADNNFVVPNSSNIPQPIVKKEQLDHENIVNENKTVEPSPSTEDRPTKNVIGLLKRKLDDCDAKRTGRCRSFGGFPANEGVSGTKLNKSDPHNEPSDNQPLHMGHSVSQCFDAFSDSLLSKFELADFNGSEISSPKAREPGKQNVALANNLKADVSRNFGGFSHEEANESCRLSLHFKSIFKKQYKQGENGRALILKPGQSITTTFINQTSSERQLFFQCEENVDLKKGIEEQNFVMVETVPKKTERKRVESKIAATEIGKRKHADTDSDTPLTSVKKPRVGNEILGRKLFSDDSDDEDHKELKRLGNDDIQAAQSMEVQEFTVEAEEEDVDLTEERMSAILLQEKTIRNKKRTKIKPTVGTLLSERLANSKNRTSWSDLVGSTAPMPLGIEQVKQNHPDAKVLDVTASNATCYSFLSSSVTGKKNVVSLDVGEGATLIFNKNGQAGVSEFSQAFLAMPGVDPKLLPTGWAENHYKWIIWKLAALDRIRFGSIQFVKNLTPQRVMGELKYRYDREIDKAQRPALRRILEKDDVPSRRMVLCISTIKECVVTEATDKEARTVLGLPRWKIEATDGWYDIPLTIDSAMADYVSTGKIKEGTKIITYGAELMECERGFFPLEKPPNVSLKIHSNCTRRARWDTKLGYQKNSRPVPVKLRDIISAGGMIGLITAAAARVYPVLYREKTADGKSIYRNAKCEEKAAVAYEREVEIKMDAMYAEAQKNFDSKKKTGSDGDFDTSQQSMQRYNNYERKQEEFKRELELQVRQGLPPRRDVTTVLKVRLVDDFTSVVLSIWGAGEDSECNIREGDTVSVYNSFSSGHRGGDLNLTANRFTHIKTEPLLKLVYPNRVCTLIPDIGVTFEPKFGEFDTVGVVVSSGSAPYGMKNFETVNIAYPKSDNTGSSYLSVLFWNGLASFGYQNMFTPGSFIACSNLEWRRNLWTIAVAYCSEKSVFTINPRQAHLMKELRNLKALVQNPQSYAGSCAEEVATELAKKPQRSNLGTPSSLTNGDRSVSFASPADNYSPANVTLQKRLEKLSRYGTSPDTPNTVWNSSSSVKKGFTPVTRRNT